MILLTEMLRISVSCGRQDVVSIENPSFFHSFFIFWVGGTKMIPSPACCAQLGVENFSACNGLNFIPIGNSLNQLPIILHFRYLHFRCLGICLGTKCPKGTDGSRRKPLPKWEQSAQKVLRILAPAAGSTLSP